MTKSPEDLLLYKIRIDTQVARLKEAIFGKGNAEFKGNLERKNQRRQRALDRLVRLQFEPSYQDALEVFKKFSCR